MRTRAIVRRQVDSGGVPVSAGAAAEAFVLNYQVFTSFPFCLNSAEQVLKVGASSAAGSLRADRSQSRLYAFYAKRKIPHNAYEMFILAHAYFNEWAELEAERDLP